MPVFNSQSGYTLHKRVGWSQGTRLHGALGSGLALGGGVRNIRSIRTFLWIALVAATSDDAPKRQTKCNSVALYSREAVTTATISNRGLRQLKQFTIMGWISNRRMKTGHGVAHGVQSARRSAPLRKIVGIVTHGDWSLFGRGDYVELECGHRVYSKGDKKARCLKCQTMESGNVTL